MYLLGIDNGGSDIKCAVYDLNGKELAISRTQIPMNIPEAGFTERDVENVWEANVKVIKAVLKKAEIPGEDVVAIGVTGYGNGMVLLDEEGQHKQHQHQQADEGALILPPEDGGHQNGDDDQTQHQVYGEHRRVAADDGPQVPELAAGRLGFVLHKMIPSSCISSCIVG